MFLFMLFFVCRVKSLFLAVYIVIVVFLREFYDVFTMPFYTSTFRFNY